MKMNIEQIVAAAPFRVVRFWDDGSTTEIRCLTKATAERVKAERSVKMGLRTRDGKRCTRIEIQTA
jgi:hypothetical protein